jgi:eukaryotic-like serine/threonine-protein kinase
VSAKAGSTEPKAVVVGASDAPSIGPTAMLPAIGLTCPSCRKANHPGVPHCVFCGSAFDASHSATRAVEDAALAPTKPEEPSALTVTGGATTRRGGWTEGPEEQPRRPVSDAPPPSRRAFLSTDSDEMAAPVADPLIGVIVADRYRIVEPLGRGGMGIVYKVEHVRIGKLLAMKLLTGELSRNPEVVRRFKQEALTVSKLNSPNTVQVFDFGIAEGLTYLVMELVTGEDLARVLRTLGPMPFPRLGKIVIQVAASLAEAHQKGIVHRDVKPENVMLVRAKDNADVAKVLDFGLAKLREGADLNDVTSQGAIVGTPYFMAPEQIRGEPVDNRTDVYALGALMYRALTGHYPFNGPTPMSVFTKHLTEEPIHPSMRAPELGIPFDAGAIVMKALSKSPSDRYQKVEDLQAALVGAVRAAGTSSVEDLLDSGQVRRLARVAAEHDVVKADIATRDEVERYERKLRRQRYSFVVVIVAVLAGVGYGGFRFYRHERAQLAKGREHEPNDTAAEATRLPFGTTITGHLGKRIDPTHGDRDFYAVDLPITRGASATIALKVTALPNFPTCTMIYRQGYSTALGQYCVGRPGRELSIAALRLDPGRYFLAVVQDLDPYGGPTPFIHENVSDAYSVTIGPAEDEPRVEVEPNDHVPSASAIGPGASMRGRLAWTRDEDVYCVARGTKGALRWKVTDQVRDAGAVLEVTPMRGKLEGAPVRVHTGLGKPTATDVVSPWTSEKIAEVDDEPRCLKVRLAIDPWAGAAAMLVPNGSDDAYTVEAMVE